MLRCSCKNGCGYTAPEREFITGRASPPFKCPRCKKTTCFLNIPKGEDIELFVQKVNNELRVEILES